MIFIQICVGEDKVNVMAIYGTKPPKFGILW
jgi:hypothetical protein